MIDTGLIRDTVMVWPIDVVIRAIIDRENFNSARAYYLNDILIKPYPKTRIFLFGHINKDGHRGFGSSNYHEIYVFNSRDRLYNVLGIGND